MPPVSMQIARSLDPKYVKVSGRLQADGGRRFFKGGPAGDACRVVHMPCLRWPCLQWLCCVRVCSLEWQEPACY